MAGLRRSVGSDFEIEHEPSDVKIAGHTFTRFAYKSSLAGLHWLILSTGARCHAVTFTFTGTDTAAPPALWAVDVDKSETRMISRLTGSMKLFDISSTGRVLLSNGMWRAALEYQAPGDSTERDLSWLDWSMLADLSADGRTLLFTEGREGGGSNSSVSMSQPGCPT